MKAHRILAAAGFLLASSGLSAIPALAQQGAPQGPPPPSADRRGPPQAGRRGPPTIDARVQRMTTELGLSADQGARVTALLAAERRQADSILAQRARQQDAERTAMINMRTSTEKALASILTPEQRTKHDAMRARGGPDGRGMRGMRGGHPGGRGGEDGRGPDRDGRRPDRR